MLVVNLFGAPGSGKSTGAAMLFSRLKLLGYNAELVTEFAKDLAWEGRKETFSNEVYLFAKQHHRLFRLNGKVDVAITDRPLILTRVYNNLYGFNSPELDALATAEFKKYDNLNFLVRRAKPYNPAGRNQTEAESDALQTAIISDLQNTDGGQVFWTITGAMAGYDRALDMVVSTLYDRGIRTP